MESLQGILGILLFCSLLGVAVTISKSIGGFMSGSAIAVESNETGVLANPVSVPQGWTGNLSTRTDNNNGTLTMDSASHTITTGARLDIFWNGGAAYGATVGTVAGTSVPFTTSAGDNLPVVTTVVTAAVPVDVAFNVTGNNVVFVGCNAPNVEAMFVFADASNRLAVHLKANDLYMWNLGSGLANPLATFTPTRVYISHADSTAAHTDMTAGVITHN